MDASFWHRKWAANEIGFHESTVNPLLLKYIEALTLAQGSRIFLPLCGKSLDIHWLLSQGYRVAGAELSEIAIEQLFAELNLTPDISTVGELRHYSAKNLDIFVGDIFDLTGEALGQIDAIYDRAALVALPQETRLRYSAHLAAISDLAQQLLICFEYDQSLQDGPPFSISDEEVRQHYGKLYALTLLARIDVPGGLKGKCPAHENIWVLSKY
ncbi:thiopurine S-methyltransferase [Undibacterium sp. TS12]|uniref:thiopurine S-methyltransferase n=1 Tax=Undibacterium sp. TS12 TaxID=2908202 RepID=UPI001F4C7A62|nr:thiopurine S-methyltransferase [Undibacterium sp. TS12]MCH8621376.1 thiopurine S-methyltransferase [Undibacterium sp. TS12]